MKSPAIFFLFIPLLLLSGCNSPGPAKPDGETGIGLSGRELRYHPDHGDFVVINGDRCFNRALYGTHTAFRVEAGDLPEFAMYLRGMGGNFKMGLVSGDHSLWLTEADEITARYRPGSMLYEIRDSILGEGVLHLQLLALAEEEGMVLRVRAENVGEQVELFWAYGGANGQRFSRDGDLGAGPESVFYLKPEYCQGNRFETNGNSFSLLFTFHRSGDAGEIFGLVPPGGQIKVCDSERQDSPLGLWRSEHWDRPLIAGSLEISREEDLYFILSRESRFGPGDYAGAGNIFKKAEETREQLAGRIRIDTPDAFINNYGAALAVAADAIWEPPSYLHGAVAWRMRLQGWRGAYAADWLGWHDRARQHFEGYARAQYTEPASGPPAPDPATHLSRQEEKKGKSLFTEGYISRTPNQIGPPHHYDMNLVLIDQLLWHIQWTGDLEFARDMWPVIKRHLAWEKRCFDADDDGLYDAYACIWASDALQYSGGGVTHSSAYNYRGNLLAARIAELIGEDSEPYRNEAEKILSSVNSELWMPGHGWYGEYKDLLGLKRVHPVPAIWTIYHALDEGIADPFQAIQSLHYVDRNIPHIPARIRDLPGEEFFSLSTSSWMPYEWSINNVALAENLHTALAYWQGGEPEEAFRLWKSQILESMYLGGSPGNFHQLSSLDKFRGELYRDFADPVGMGARTLVEGLFGIRPQLADGKLIIEPGLPRHWEFATLETPDIRFEYKRRKKSETFLIIHHFPSDPDLVLRIPARAVKVESLTVNGQEAEFIPVENAVSAPKIEIRLPFSEEYIIQIKWTGNLPESPEVPPWIVAGDTFDLAFRDAELLEVYDPQSLLSIVDKQRSDLSAVVSRDGSGDFFIRLKQAQMNWWAPVELEIRNAVEFLPATEQKSDAIRVKIKNNTGKILEGAVTVSGSDYRLPVQAFAPGESGDLEIPAERLMPGTNRISFKSGSVEITGDLINWQIEAPAGIRWVCVDMSGLYNDLVTNIFRNEYLSPRCPYPTLQLPVQGIGDWCSYAKTANIDDTGIREKAGSEGIFRMKQGIPVRTPGEAGIPNILFTSLWDNYPDSAVVALEGRASHAYLLMAGSTHHMQSRIANGEVVVRYADGNSERLELVNPDTWWPIEQDYYTDGYAFRIDAPRPPRVHLKTGEVPEEPYPVLAVNKSRLIDGGAATMLDIPLDPRRELKSLCLRTLSDDVVIGLMSVTLASVEE